MITYGIQNDVETARKSVKEVWVAMCKFDNIHPDALFVNFSDKNPFTAEYNHRMGVYMSLARRTR